jgi:hypothetical protein
VNGEGRVKDGDRFPVHNDRLPVHSEGRVEDGEPVPVLNEGLVKDNPGSLPLEEAFPLDPQGSPKRTCRTSPRSSEVSLHTTRIIPTKGQPSSEDNLGRQLRAKGSLPVGFRGRAGWGGARGGAPAESSMRAYAFDEEG